MHFKNTKKDVTDVTEVIGCHSDPNHDPFLHQICHFHGEEDRRQSLRPAGGPGGGQPQNGDDHLCLPDGERHEEAVEETNTHTHTHLYIYIYI